MRHAWLVFGRESNYRYEPWWPLYQDDGPQLASTGEEAIRVVKERLALGGEMNWVDLCAVPASEWVGPSLREDT